MSTKFNINDKVVIADGTTSKDTGILPDDFALCVGIEGVIESVPDSPGGQYLVRFPHDYWFFEEAQIRLSGTPNQSLEAELSTLRAENERMMEALGRIIDGCRASFVDKYWVASVARDALAPRGPEGEG